MNKELIISSFAGAFAGVIFTQGLLHVGRCPFKRSRETHDGEINVVDTPDMKECLNRIVDNTTTIPPTPVVKLNL
jgi:hypothetical protein